MRRDTNERGSVIFFVIILLAIIAGGYYFLVNLKKQSDADGQAFARAFIERVVTDHDLKYLHSIVAADRAMVITPGKEFDFVETCKKLGKPSPDYRMEGKLEFQNYFFSPEGSYTTVLTYPDRHATLIIAIERPSGLWLLRDFSITWERPAG